MAIRCVLLNNKNQIEDNYADFIVDAETRKTELVIESKVIAQRYEVGDKIRFQYVNRYKDVFEGKIIEVEDEVFVLQNIVAISSSLNVDVKVDVDIDAELFFTKRIIIEGEDYYDEESGQVRIRVTDVSSGGMCFQAKENLDLDIEYECVTKWTRMPVIVKCKLCREEKVSKTVYSYGCKFLDLDVNLESILRSAVFAIQASQHRMRRR
ncbi:MAG: PilZ domain-containing protein [Anaerotignaceae bacterium]